MTHSHPPLCRVSLHADAGQADMALPAGVPIAALIPPIVDTLTPPGTAVRSGLPGAPYRLARPGEAALDTSMTLAQHAIRDGAVLVLTRAPTRPPVVRFDDPAERAAATVRSVARPWTPRAARLAAAVAAGWLGTLGVALSIRSNFSIAAAAAAAGAGCALVAAVFADRVYRDTQTCLTMGLFAVGLAATAGFTAVPPGSAGPGAPNALLAATAAAAVAVLAMQLTRCAGPAMTAVCALTALAGAAALTAVLTGFPPQVIGALTTTAALALMQVAGRISIGATGLARRLEAADAGADDQVRRAHGLLTGLVAAFSAAAALAASGTAVGGHPGGVAFTGVTGAVLLLQARSHTDRSRVIALAGGGVAAVTAALTAATQQPAWPCAGAAALAGLALYLGFAAPTPSPLTRRAIELLEYLLLAALIPLACWICGLYGAARDLNLS